MIGPVGLLLHMAGAGVVGAIAGGYGMLRFTARAVYARADKRDLRHELELILEPDSKRGLRLHEEAKFSDWLRERFRQER